MNTIFKGLAFSAIAMAGTASAAEVLVTTNITTSTTWTADNTYNLQGQIYVEAGATLTIDPGVRVASDLGGSLAVANGAQIFVNGTAANPVVMTSKLDDGTWREAANEWGNLTIMGDGYISENATPGNVAHPDANNVATMEGLGSGGSLDLYGGGNDDDDSGVLNYLSIRYGGKVVSLANELNGLSLGGLGRGTDIDYVEIMNNVDDGIEIWGGAVNIKHASIWNVGDDSFDVDQGWRGKGQFLFIVQGYSLDASQGSGVGDNAFETDGAEDSDWQPVTTAAIYNATVIGQPVAGDGLTAWRDNARVQYHQSVFMDGGEKVVRDDNLDGDGAQGYGHNGTLTWAETWSTPYTATSTVNPAQAPLTPADLYQSQTTGNLAGMYDSVFFRNLNGSAYTAADAVGVFDAANNNVKVPGFADADSPIRCLVRGDAVSKGGKTMVPVAYVDPRAANDALASVSTPPADGFYDATSYRGAFSASENWLAGWSAADEFGFLTDGCATTREGSGLNVPFSLAANGKPALGNTSWGFVVDNPTASCGVGAGSVALVFVSFDAPLTLPLGGMGCSGGTGELLIGLNVYTTLAGLYLGAPATLPAPLPANPAFAGAAFSAQSVFATPTGDLRLGSAMDVVLGSY